MSNAPRPQEGRALGIIDSLKGLVSGSGTRTVALQLQPNEVEVTRAVASNRPGGMTSVGGDLILTNVRLVFTPLNVKDVSAVLTWGLGKAGVPAGVTKLVDGVGKLIETQDYGSLLEISQVISGSAASLLKAPTLVISSSSGSYEIGILATRLSPNASSANIEERDRMVAIIQARLIN